MRTELAAAGLLAGSSAFREAGGDRKERGPVHTEPRGLRPELTELATCRAGAASRVLSVLPARVEQGQQPELVRGWRGAQALA